MITLYNPARVEINPLVIRRITPKGELYDSENVKATGEFARVNVQTGDDLAFVRMLQYGTDYHAPVSGDGILIKASLLKRP